MNGTAGPRIAVIANPRSRALRAGRFGLGPALAGLPHAAPDSPEALRQALAAFAVQGVGLLAVQGGDGTLREVLTALPAAYGDDPPEIALLATGKTNLAARVLGGAGPGAAALARLRQAAACGALRRRSVPVLEVARAGQTPLRGLLFGLGAFTEAKLLAQRKLDPHGIHDRLAVLLALLGVARSVWRADHRLRLGLPMTVSADGEAPRGGARFLALATPLDRLMLGLWPFWGEGPGRLRWLDVMAPPRRLTAALLAARMRRPRPWMPAAGYHSQLADRVVLGFAAPFVLDGEIFEPGPQGVVLSAPGQAVFVTP
jgi:hypothetical protein